MGQRERTHQARADGATAGRAPSPGFVRRAFVGLALAAGFVAAGLLLWNALDVVLLAFAGVLLATFLDAPARALSERTRVRHGLAVGATVLALLALGAVFGALAGPRIADQATQLVERLPGSLAQVQERIRQLPGGDWVMDRLTTGGQGAGGAAISGSNLISNVTGTASMFWDVIARFIFVVFLGIYLATSPRTYRDGLATLVPPAGRDRAVEVLDRVGKVLRGWLLGQLVAMLIVGVLTWIGLAILGVPLALVLAFIAGLLEFVPIVGPVVAFVPAFLLALTQGGSTVLWVIGLYLAIQQLEGNVIVPLVQRRTVSLPPALTIAAVFVAGAAFGPVGMLVATPLAAVGLTLYEMLYRHDLLGEHVALPAGGEE